MKKRLTAGVLWFFATWYAWDIVAYTLGLPILLAPFLGLAVGAFVVLDPMARIWAPKPAPAQPAPQLEPDAA
jgi:hypothetical protein